MSVALANVQTLRNNLGALSDSDRNFANSLIESFNRRGLSQKQEHWVGVLAQRAVTVRPPVVNIGDLTKVIEMFDGARERGLNRRAILLDGGADVGTLRVTVAGAASRNPGSLNVTDKAAFDDRRWFGRIDRAGNFHPTSRIAVPTGVEAALKAFALDPQGVARLYGQQTGTCMFCARELTDNRSIVAGYGPVCASKWALPWGE